jgi:hypothetical protein
VRLQVDDVCAGGRVRDRATVIQKKTGRPVQFEITEQTRASIRYREGRRKSGSQRTRRWRERDSNPRSPGYGKCIWARATRPRRERKAWDGGVQRRELGERFPASGGAFHMDKAGPRAARSGFGDTNVLRHPSLPSRQRSRSLGRIGFDRSCLNRAATSCALVAQSLFRWASRIA